MCCLTALTAARQSSNKSCCSFWLPSLECSCRPFPGSPCYVGWLRCSPAQGAPTGRVLTPRDAAGWAVSFVAGPRPLPCVRHPVLLCRAPLSANSILRHTSGKETLAWAVCCIILINKQGNHGWGMKGCIQPQGKDVKSKQPCL